MRHAWIAALNLALAVTLSTLSPAEPKLNDRQAYDYVGRSPFSPNCPFSIYCYRVLAPAVVQRLPFDPDRNWRAYQITANAAASTILVAAMATPPVVAALASVITQTSYGFAFTAYDPYAAEPMVFVFAAMLVWCWARNRVGPAIVISAVGIFAKETVALIAGALAIAALIERFAYSRDSHARAWQAWLLPAIVSGTVLAAFHVISRAWLGWEIASNPAAQLSHGSWIGLWWRNNPFLERKLYMIFATFGFAWVLAILGWRTALPHWRALALGTIPPMLLLVVAQTPERAIGNAFYVVVPLAAWYAARSPLAAAIAIALNGLVTAKAGTSSIWLPSARWTLLPAAVAVAIIIFRMQRLKSMAR